MEEIVRNVTSWKKSIKDRHGDRLEQLEQTLKARRGLPNPRLCRGASRHHFPRPCVDTPVLKGCSPAWMRGSVCSDRPCFAFVQGQSGAGEGHLAQGATDTGYLAEVPSHDTDGVLSALVPKDTCNHVSPMQLAPV